MKTDTMLQKAKEVVVEYFNNRVDKIDDFELKAEDVFIVWFSKTLQNWKALVSTTVADSMYYEVTYNGNENEIYIDAYKKFENVRLEFVRSGKTNKNLEVYHGVKRYY